MAGARAYRGRAVAIFRARPSAAARSAVHNLGASAVWALRGGRAQIIGGWLERVLTEGGPSLFSELVRQQLLDQLFITSAPALFGRYAGDERKSLADGL